MQGRGDDLGAKLDETGRVRLVGVIKGVEDPEADVEGQSGEV